jgi:hypothetical protein
MPDEPLTNPNDPDQLMRDEAAAELLDVTVAALQDWRYRKIGPPVVRLARKAVRYRRGDLLAFIASKTESAGGGAR